MSSVVICPTCGHPNDVDASFCEQDDTWLGGEHRRAEESGKDKRSTGPTATGDERPAADAGATDRTAPQEPRARPPERLGAVDPRLARQRVDEAATDRGDGERAAGERGVDDTLDHTLRDGDEPVAGEVALRRRPDLSGPRCRACGRLAPAGAAVCECGEPLRPDRDDAAGVGPQRPRRGDRDEQGVGRAAFVRAQRRANGGRRPRFDRPLVARVVWVRSITAAVLGLVVVAVLAGWHRTVADTVAGAVARIVPGMVEQIDVASTRTEDDGDDGGSLNAVDGTDLAWETPWDADAADPAAPCGTARGGATLLRVSFAEPTSVSQITVLPGLAEDDRRRPLQFRPRRVDVVFDDGTCVPVDLADGDAPGVVDLQTAVSSTAGATVAIVDAYPKPDGGEDLVAIREIRFGRR